jgi:hypothetical protein
MYAQIYHTKPKSICYCLPIQCGVIPLTVQILMVCVVVLPAVMDIVIVPIAIFVGFCVVCCLPPADPTK